MVFVFHLLTVSLSIIFSSSIHVVTKGRGSFFLSAVQYSIVVFYIEGLLAESKFMLSSMQIVQEMNDQLYFSSFGSAPPSLSLLELEFL